MLVLLLFLAAPVALADPLLRGDEDAAPPLQSIDFLKRFGYVETIKDGPAESLISEFSLRSALKEVQRFGNITQTGFLDNATLALMKSRRCGVADVIKHDDGTSSNRFKRYVIGSPGWNKRHLTYYVGNVSPLLSREEGIRELKSAMETWGRYGRLRFTEVPSAATADIIFGFFRQAHGDMYPFDGQGQVLAHAYFPSQWGSYGGDVHFDADELWEVYPRLSEDGVDFGMVALHELGHSLGLSHSAEPDSVMNPYYRAVGSDRMRLGRDDVDAMYALYIARDIGDDGTTKNQLPEDPPYKPVDPVTPRRPVTYPTTRRPTTRTTTIPTTRRTTTEPTTRRTPPPPTTRRTPPTTRRITTVPTTFRTTMTTRTSHHTTTSRRIMPESTTQRVRPSHTKAPYPWRPPSIPTRAPSTGSTNQASGSKGSVEVVYHGDDESVETHKEHDRWHGIPPPQPPPSPGCLGQFDAAALIRGEIFIIQNQTLWRLSRPGEVMNGYPVELRRFFHKLPSEIQRFDALYQREADSSIIIFSGRQYWVFNGYEMIEGSPRPITDYGLPESAESVDAAFVWGRNFKTYIFSGNQFWRYNETTRKVDPEYPRPIAKYWHVPSPIDAVLTDTSGITYFFKEDDYWAFDDIKIRPREGYPRRASTFWIGC